MKQKQKTRKAAAKRFTLTGSGKIRRKKAGSRHLLNHESPSQKRRRHGLVTLSSADQKKVTRMLGL